MIRTAAIVLVLFALGAVRLAAAGQGDGLIGSWEIVTFELADGSGAGHRAPFGPAPRGILILTADGRLASIVTAAERPPPLDAASRAAGFTTLLAYAGPYRIAGDRLITTVEVAWDERYVGTEQVRRFALEGDRLALESEPLVGADGARALVSWRRIAPAPRGR
jgi:hypothetical protein